MTELALAQRIRARRRARDIRRRERVVFRDGGFLYRIDLLSTEPGDAPWVQARVRARIERTEAGYRLRVEGWAFGGTDTPYRLFYDNGPYGGADREQIGEIYQRVLPTAFAWLRRIVQVDDIDALPELR